MRNTNLAEDGLYIEKEASLKMEYWKAISAGQSKIAGVELISTLPSRVDLPSTVYTTLRTYHRTNGVSRFLCLERHVERLNSSLSIEGSGQQVELVDIKGLIKLVDTKSRIKGDLRIKILVVPTDLMEIYLSVEPFSSPDPAAYRDGVQVLTTSFTRLNPKAKVYSFVDDQARIRAEMHQDAEEILMVNDRQEILEGLSSNFFGIIENELYTADEGILNGVTRQIVIDLVQRIGIPMIFKPIKLCELGQLTECFITSTSRGILPVTRIDQSIIGAGKPGPITLQLLSVFETEIETLIQPL